MRRARTSLRHQEASTTTKVLGVLVALAVVVAVIVVVNQDDEEGDGDQQASTPYGAEAQDIESAQEGYCEDNGRYGTAEELVDAGGLDAAPELHTVALISAGDCGDSAGEGSGFALVCNSNEEGCGEGGGLPKGGTFVTGLESLPGEGTLNPAVSTQGGMQQAAGLLFSGLVEIDDEANPVPELAESWEIGDDGRVYEFTLRPGVKFHDGRPLLAADVKFSYEAALLRNHARTQASLGPALVEPCAAPPAAPSCPSIQAEEASGDSPATVTFNFAEPYAPLLQQLTHTDGAIIPKHVFDGKPLPTAAQPWPEGQPPVGTGPYRFASQDPAQIVFERNPEYFRPPFPLLDQVVQRAIPDGNARVQELQAGGIDWLWGVPGQQLAALEANDDIVVDTGKQSAGGSTNCVVDVIFNLWARGDAGAPLTPGTVDNVKGGSASPHPVLGDVEVRRALATALDRDVYVSQVLQDNGSELAQSPFSSNLEPAFTEAPLPDFDRDEAAQMLEDAGWVEGDDDVRVKDGQRLDIDISGFAGEQTTLMDKIRQDLAEVGVAVRPATVQPPQMNQLYGQRNFDSLIFSNCQGTDAEIGARRVYHSTAITGAGFTNGAGYQSDTVDEGFDRGAQALDPDERADAYAEVQEQIAEDLPTLWIFDSVANRAYRTECEGLRPYTGHYTEFAGCQS